MRVFGILLSLLMIIQYSCWLPAYAVSASVDTNGGVNASVPVNKIGALLLADATAILTSTTITIATSATSGATSAPSLQGNVYNSQVVGTGASRSIQGIAYFTDGTQIDKLTKGKERVELANGEICEGPITEVSADGIVCAGNRVLSSNLKCISSGRAFEFKIPLTGATSAGGAVSGEASSISFTKCSVKAAHAQKAPSEHSTGKRVLVTVVLLCLIATAIAVPVAVACSNRHHNNNGYNNTQQQILLNQAILRSRGSVSSSPVSQPVSQPVVNTRSDFSSSSSSSSSSGG